MPGRDGMGPLGRGAMTGRGMGLCSGAGRGLTRGVGMGRGRGMGRGFGWLANSGSVDGVSDQQAEILALRERLQALERKLADQGGEDRT